jgi:4-amino-4-deoxy-L-arabinose transferase-like glycosyltransferase
LAAQSLASRPAAPSPILLLILGAVTLCRLWAAAVIPLTEDEAYYRLWALHPQFGYFDHPPMIAWWIHAGMAMLGDTPLGVRLFPCLSCLVTSLLVFDLAGWLGCEAKTAHRAAIWCNATILIGAGGLLAIPDAACVPFWTLTLWCLARTKGPGAPAWWAAAGAAAGLACLSKYSALFLAPGVVLWLLLQPGGLTALRRPWPWIAALIAVAIFSLNVAWNAEHHWVSFAKQFGRAAPGRLAPKYELELILGQLLLLNPFIAIFVLRAMPRWRPRASAGRGSDLSLVLATAAPFAAYLMLHALHDRVQAHWPVPIYPGLAIVAAAAASGSRGPVLIALRALAAPFGLGLAALALLHLALPATDLPGRVDPATEVRGWSDFAAKVEAERVSNHAAWIGAFSYGVTAQLSAQPALRVPVMELIERERYAMAPAVNPADLSRPGLVVDLDRRLTVAKLQACFAAVKPLGPMIRGRSVGHDTRYALFLVDRPRVNVQIQGCAATP